MSSIWLVTITFWLLIPILVFAVVACLASFAMAWYCRRALINPWTVLRSFSPKPSSFFRWPQYWSLKLVGWTFSIILILLAVFQTLPWLDAILVNLDQQRNLLAIEQLLRNEEVRFNISDWLKKHEANEAKTKDNKSRVDIIRALSFVNSNNSEDKTATNPLLDDAEIPTDEFQTWLKGDEDSTIASFRQEIIKRLAASVSLRESNSYLPLSPHQNRSVFSVRKRLEADAYSNEQFGLPTDVEESTKRPISTGKTLNWPKDKWFVLSILFSTGKEVRKVADPKAVPSDSRTSAEDHSDKKKVSLTPAHFDGMRTRLLAHTYSWTGYLRSVYAGWPNVLIVVVAIGLFGLQYSRHLRFQIRDELQTPPPIKLADTTEFSVYLFEAGQVSPEIIADLDGNVMNTWLNSAFQSKDITLTQEAQISTATPQSEWRILQDQKSYLVRKENGTLRIYFDTVLQVDQWLVLQEAAAVKNERIFLWQYRNIAQFGDRIHKQIVDGRLSPVLEQLDTTLSDLEAAIPHWHGISEIGIQESARKIVAEKSEQVAEKWLLLLPSASASAKRHIELLTELGFIGTVIGIIAGMADAALTQVPSDDSLFRSTATGQMLSSLSIAFSTTLIGLLCAMILGWIYAQWEQREKQGVLDATTRVRTHLETNCLASTITHYGR